MRFLFYFSPESRNNSKIWRLGTIKNHFQYELKNLEHHGHFVKVSCNRHTIYESIKKDYINANNALIDHSSGFGVSINNFLLKSDNIYNFDIIVIYEGPKLKLTKINRANIIYSGLGLFNRDIFGDYFYYSRIYNFYPVFERKLTKISKKITSKTINYLKEKYYNYILNQPLDANIYKALELSSITYFPQPYDAYGIESIFEKSLADKDRLTKICSKFNHVNLIFHPIIPNTFDLKEEYENEFEHLTVLPNKLKSKPFDINNYFWFFENIFIENSSLGALGILLGKNVYTFSNSLFSNEKILKNKKIKIVDSISLERLINLFIDTNIEFDKVEKNEIDLGYYLNSL